MKIGILTFHRAFNYGAVLQCYALSEVLKGMGHDVEVIDYRPAYIESYRKVFSASAFSGRSLKAKFKTICLLPATAFKKRKATFAFDTFLQSRLKQSAPVYRVSNLPTGYDCIVFGSDQIWSSRICHGFDPVFWGQFPKGQTRFVAYAPSLENYQDFTEQQWKTVLTALDSFDHISVREEAFRDELARRTTRKISCVLDPTLLVSADTLKKCVKRPTIDHYIFLFTVQPGSLPYEIARRVAKERGWKIVRARATQRLSGEPGVIQMGACSPEEFLGLISYAECVVTNSFHATALSIQLEKKFFSVQSERPKRVVNILNALGLEDRYVTNVKYANVDLSIDYTSVRKKLGVMAAQSQEYLRSALS